MQINFPGCVPIGAYEGMSDEQWHAIRRTGIGGSDAATVMGVNRYSSPLALWAEKTGRLPREDGDSEAAKVGTIMEPLIRQNIVKPYLQEKGYKVDNVYDPTHVYRSRQWPWMIANIDGAIEVGGQLYPLEIKTGGSYQLRDWGGEEGYDVPAAYQMQCRHILAVTGAESMLIFGLIGNRRLYRWVTADEAMRDELAERERVFWDLVELNDPMHAPLAMGTDADMDVLQAMADPERERAAAVSADDIEEYVSLGELIKDKEAERERIKQRIIQAMAGSTVGECDEYRVSFRPVSTSRIDTKALKAEHAELVQRYTNETESFRFSVKGK